jgi:hypothetical protein
MAKSQLLPTERTKRGGGDFESTVHFRLSWAMVRSPSRLAANDSVKEEGRLNRDSEVPHDWLLRETCSMQMRVNIGRARVTTRRGGEGGGPMRRSSD